MHGVPPPALAADVPGGGYIANQNSPDDASCTLTFNSVGTFVFTDDLAESGTWKTGGGTGADYWVRWDNTSGTLSSGTTGSWLQLNSGRSFNVTFTSFNGSKSCTGTVRIASDSAGVNVLDSASVTITATVNP
jgi:hypothetical protein